MADYNGEDAIYVVNVGENGLPVVGHAVLFVQDSEGNWYMTEFTGAKKRLAKVYISKMDEADIQAFLSSKGRSAVYIYGDFTASYTLALEYVGTDYGGYNLFTNNCLHYVKELLGAGIPESGWFDIVINSAEICPMNFFISLKAVDGIQSWLRPQQTSTNATNAVHHAKGGMRFAYICWQENE